MNFFVYIYLVSVLKKLYLLQGINAALFYENKNVREYVSLVPTSAHSGDGMGNLIAILCELAQTMMAKRLAYSDELQATVMEVRKSYLSLYCWISI